MARSEWTDEQIEAIRGMVAEGKFYSVIAERFGVTRNSIVGVCSRNGIHSPNVQKEWTDEQIAVVRGLAASGMASAVIARQIGVGRDSVRAVCRRNQIALFLGTGGRKTASKATVERPDPKPKKTPPRLELVEAVSTEAIPFFELRKFRTDETNECRRLLDGQHGMYGLVCAAPTPPGKSWCPACARRLLVAIVSARTPRAA